MQNLHRIMGASYKRFKPGLCGTCKHNTRGFDWGGGEWPACAIDGKLMSDPDPRVKKGRCKFYEKSE